MLEAGLTEMQEGIEKEERREEVSLSATAAHPSSPIYPSTAPSNRTAFPRRHSIHPVPRHPVTPFTTLSHHMKARRRLEERKAERAADESGSADEDEDKDEDEAVLIDIQSDGEPVDVEEGTAVV